MLLQGCQVGNVEVAESALQVCDVDIDDDALRAVLPEDALR